MSTTFDSPPLTNDADLRTKRRQLTIAIAGNPNAGKTSLFNALTGLRQKVANYPGVTVERKEGIWALEGGRTARLIDLPGLYSLDASSIDERIARDVLMGRARGLPAPDAIIAVVDATNLARNLYLITQLLEYEPPVVIALTMVDMAERRGIDIDVQRLRDLLGVPVVPVVAPQRRGLNELSRAVSEAARHGATKRVQWRLSEQAEREIAALCGDGEAGPAARRRVMEELYGEELPPDQNRRALILAARQRLQAHDPNWWQEPLLARYRFIERIIAEVERTKEAKRDLTMAIDSVITHRFFGPLILAAIMLLVFQTIFAWARVPMDLIDGAFGALAQAVHAYLPPGLFTDLLADGIVAGVGSVLVFLPQITLLFLFITLLEDSGYMARAAFIMDRLMRGVGLHGKAFVPLLSSFACAIPGIMATRTIENQKDRLATILIAPFMSCSARLPVYTLMIAAFFSDRRIFGFLSVGALLIMAMYLLGITVAVCVAWVLKRTILRGPTPPLVMELPPYRLPNPLTILQTIWSRAWLFVRRAGTVILAISIILWALANFPRVAPEGDRAQTVADRSAVESEQLKHSFAGRLGHLIEPVIAPLGFDWQMGIGLISSFAARETLVSTLSIVYNVGREADSSSPSLIEAIRKARRPDGRPAWTPLTAISMMVFFVLACQCMSTVAVVRRETNSWRWPIFMVLYMTALAYAAAFITYQGGRLLGFG
ncbi:ferrous iron transport protein B [Pyrinomonas methylaliphatogenes]|uniref:Ferrous iron transport protein B n=1 Tax=Pyrinomonas methylaliphatogenes TaxID=454194 RepID=A0A0B6WZ14_9BACT|nr:ferrous iron transport protein B [Pyrinomonas methylaliphatogenes]CDM65529.1 ferrous iron transporter FeoB [Pyrinomonas methylaliphatogenes]